MPKWLYKFFGETIALIIFQKDGHSLAKPPTFSNDQVPLSPVTFWIHPPEPAILLARCHFDPTIYY